MPGTQQGQAYCPVCQRPTLHARTWPTLETWQWLAHVSLCCVTCGAWVVALLIHVLVLDQQAKNAHWICQTCGHDAG